MQFLNKIQIGKDELEAPAVKTKKLTGTTASSEGSEITIAHGLTSGKIIGISGIIETGTNSGWKLDSAKTGYRVSVSFDATNIIIRNASTQSESVLSKPVRLIVTYEI